MYHTNSRFSSLCTSYPLVALSLFFVSSVPGGSSLSSLLTSRGLILFFGCILFFAIVLVVLILDLSLGGFGS